MWNDVFDSLLELLEGSAVHVQTFVDDMVHVASAVSVEDIESMISPVPTEIFFSEYRSNAGDEEDEPSMPEELTLRDHIQWVCAKVYRGRPSPYNSVQLRSTQQESGWENRCR